MTAKLNELPLDILRRVSQFMTSQELMCLAGCCKSLNWKCIKAKGWTYYRFDLMNPKKWKLFYDLVWKCPNVQQLLDYKLDAWASSSSHLPDWISGSDLWRYSMTDAFWHHEISEKVEKKLNDDPNLLSTWKAGNGYAGFDHEDSEDDENSEFDFGDMMTEFYASSEYNALWKASEPAQNSFRAQIMHMGANQLADVMKQVEIAMFGQGIVIQSESLWKYNQDITNKNNPHQPAKNEPGEELICIVPKYKFIIDFVRLECTKIQDVLKHFVLKGTEVEAYQDCGRNLEDVEYEIELDCYDDSDDDDE